MVSERGSTLPPDSSMDQSTVGQPAPDSLAAPYSAKGSKSQHILVPESEVYDGKPWRPNILWSELGHGRGFKYFQPQAEFIYNNMSVQILLACLIGMNFCTNIIQKQFDPREVFYVSEFELIEDIFSIIFTMELVLNMYSTWPFRFWRSNWNRFDFVVVTVGLLYLFRVNLPPPLQMLRVMRAFRVFRLFKKVESLKKIIDSLVNAVPGVTHAFTIMLLVMSIFAIVAVDFFGKVGYHCNPDSDHASVSSRGNCVGEEYFGTFFASLYSLFQILIGDSWSEAVVRPLMHEPDVDSCGPSSYNCMRGMTISEEDRYLQKHQTENLAYCSLLCCSNDSCTGFRFENAVWNGRVDSRRPGNCTLHGHPESHDENKFWIQQGRSEVTSWLCSREEVSYDWLRLRGGSGHSCGKSEVVGVPLHDPQDCMEEVRSRANCSHDFFNLAELPSGDYACGCVMNTSLDCTDPAGWTSNSTVSIYMIRRSMSLWVGVDTFLTGMFFVSFILLNAVVLINIVVAVLLEKMVQPADGDESGEKTDEKDGPLDSDRPLAEFVFDSAWEDVARIRRELSEIRTQLAEATDDLRVDLDTTRADLAAMSSTLDEVMRLVNDIHARSKSSNRWQDKSWRCNSSDGPLLADPTT